LGNANVDFILALQKKIPISYTFNFHCVIVQQALYTQVIDFNMRDMLCKKIVNSILAGPLQQKPFKH
jgi:hypothetical protein